MPRPACRPSTPTPGSNSNRGYRWETGSPGLTLTNIILTAELERVPDVGLPVGLRPRLRHRLRPPLHASSNHPGGVNILLADGSVRFVKNSIGQTVWMSLGSRDGGEVVSSDSY